MPALPPGRQRRSFRPRFAQKMQVLDAACDGRTAKECAAFANANKPDAKWEDIPDHAAARWIREIKNGVFPSGDRVAGTAETHAILGAQHREKKKAFMKKWRQTASLRDPAAKKAKAKAEKEEKKAAMAKATKPTKKAAAKKSAEPATTAGKKTKKKTGSSDDDDDLSFAAASSSSAGEEDEDA